MNLVGYPVKSDDVLRLPVPQSNRGARGLTKIKEPDVLGEHEAMMTAQHSTFEYGSIANITISSPTFVD